MVCKVFILLKTRLFLSNAGIQVENFVFINCGLLWKSFFNSRQRVKGFAKELAEFKKDKNLKTLSQKRTQAINSFNRSTFIDDTYKIESKLWELLKRDYNNEALNVTTKTLESVNDFYTSTSTLISAMKALIACLQLAFRSDVDDINRSKIKEAMTNLVKSKSTVFEKYLPFKCWRNGFCDCFYKNHNR